MPEQMAEDADKPDLASVEADLFGGLIEFYEKVTALMRQSPFRGENATLLSERIKLVTRNVIDEVKRSRTWQLTEPLESAYEELQRFAEELSSKEGSSDGAKPTTPGSPGGTTPA